MLKINPIKINCFSQSSQNASEKPAVTRPQMDVLSNLYYQTFNLSFKGENELHRNDFDKAKKYIDGLKGKKELSIHDVDLKKADGIQFGLKTFEGLSMKELAFMLKDLEFIVTKRGCKNHCAHCSLSSEKTLKNSKNQIGTIDLENYKNLLDDIKELNNRLGFNIISNEKTPLMSLLFDSDGVDISLKDKNDKEYNYAMLSHMQYQVTGKPVIFDTAGWDKDNKSAQKRAEKIVKYYENDENSKEALQINISINPFHSLVKEAIDKLRAGDEESAFENLSKYIIRQANVLFTFTPIIEKTGLIIRIASTQDENACEEMEMYGIDMQKHINSGIEKALLGLYAEDIMGEKKYVKSTDDGIEKMNMWIDKLRDIDGYTSQIGRMNQFYKDGNNLALRIETMKKLKEEISKKGGDCIGKGFIDINGKFYLFDDPIVCPTELQFNYNDKQKKTRDPAFGLEKQYGLTKEFLQANLKDKI